MIWRRASVARKTSVTFTATVSSSVAGTQSEFLFGWEQYRSRVGSCVERRGEVLNELVERGERSSVAGRSAPTNRLL